MSILPHVERILDAARIAPSHDNLQPWRFLAEGETVSFLVDHERDRSPANAEGRMARIAVGAALECALLRAGRMGVVVRFESPRPGALVTIQLSAPKRDPEPDKALLRRATNRRLYDARPLDDATFQWLNDATPPLDGARTLWFGRERARTLGPILEQGDEVLFEVARTREGLLRGLRFDVRDREEVTQGLSLGCLELTAADRVTLDAIRHTPEDRLVAMGAFKKMGARARRLVESASGVLIVATSGSHAASDVTVGRCMQRAWLALTRRGLVAQPMTSPLQLETVLDLEERTDGTHPDGRDRAAAAVAAFRAAFPGVERSSRIGMLMRYGWAPEPTTRVRRLPLDDSIASDAPSDAPAAE
jgi:nitroreductase